MNCETARKMRQSNDPALPRHLETCLSCIVRTNARYYEAPAGLEEKIRQNLRRDISTPSPWRGIAIAASILLMTSLAWNIATLRSHVATEVLSAHLRSLTGAHLLDVPSSDRHTVKPWFNGRLDFAPQVKELDGFPLLGGRLEYFDGHPAAALVYGRRNHIVNLFLWPAAPSLQASQTRNGYHLETWSAHGMTFWAVSDLNETELKRFVSLYRDNEAEEDGLPKRPVAAPQNPQR